MATPSDTLANKMHDILGDMVFKELQKYTSEISDLPVSSQVERDAVAKVARRLMRSFPTRAASYLDRYQAETVAEGLARAATADVERAKIHPLD